MASEDAQFQRFTTWTVAGGNEHFPVNSVPSSVMSESVLSGLVLLFSISVCDQSKNCSELYFKIVRQVTNYKAGRAAATERQGLMSRQQNLHHLFISSLFCMRILYIPSVGETGRNEIRTELVRGSHLRLSLPLSPVVYPFSRKGLEGLEH